MARDTGACSTVFWHFVRLHMTRHEYERYLLLVNVNSDSGRGRAWLRSTLNENSLERYVLSCYAAGSLPWSNAGGC